MQFIELDNCFVQPQAILVIAASSFFDLLGPEYSSGHWVPSIKITLIGDEKRELAFENEEARDKRLSTIMEVLRSA